MQPYEKLGDADRFVCIVNNALTSNPPPADESEWIDRFKVLGIGPNCIGNAPDARAREALTRAIAQVVQTLSGAPAMALGGGWALPVSVSDSYGTAYRTTTSTVRRSMVASPMSFTSSRGMSHRWMHSGRSRLMKRKRACLRKTP
jgi:hypothetical protein